MRVAARRMISFFGVVGALSLLAGASASAGTRPADGSRNEGSERNESERTTTGGDCSKGCLECQKDCHESRCMGSCSMQWSGCCMTAGMKPPVAGSCTCLSN